MAYKSDRPTVGEWRRRGFVPGERPESRLSVISVSHDGGEGLGNVLRLVVRGGPPASWSGHRGTLRVTWGDGECIEWGDVIITESSIEVAGMGDAVISRLVMSYNLGPRKPGEYWPQCGPARADADRDFIRAGADVEPAEDLRHIDELIAEGERAKKLATLSRAGRWAVMG